MTPTAMIAASGRYIRCSAAISVMIGTTLEVGARIPKPTECARGPAAVSAATMIQVAARPTYSGHRDGGRASTLEAPNVQSHSSTISGAVTIASLVAIPSAHATMAPAIQPYEVRP